MLAGCCSGVVAWFGLGVRADVRVLICVARVVFQVVKWFFECVSEMTHAEQAKLLQFATGSSAVPVEGFQALQSHDGKLCWFALQSAKVKEQPFIIAHTCFNRLDVPMYRTKEELDKQLHLVLSMEVSGFGIE